MLLVCVVIITAIHNSQDRGRRSRVCFKAEYCSTEAERKHNHYKYLANIKLDVTIKYIYHFTTILDSHS